MLRSILIILCIIISAGLYLLFFMLPGVIFAKNKQSFFCNASRLWFNLILKSIGIKVKVSGLENIPAKNLGIILVSNHESMADIFILEASIPIPFRFLAKQELFKIPFLGFCMRMRGDIPIVREKRESAHQTLGQVAKVVKAGIPVHIFPEGTRTPTGEMKDFRRGAFIVAYKSGAPIIPIAIAGSFHIMPKGQFRINPASVKITIGKPIYFERRENVDQDTLRNSVEHVRDVIAEMIKEDRAKRL